MLFGIGTDICKIDRIEQTLARQGHRFVKKLLGPEELEEFHALGGESDTPEESFTPTQITFVAKRFAAKEAAAKAFGTGIRGKLSLNHIQVVHTDLGKPELALREYAQQFAQENKSSFRAPNKMSITPRMSVFRSGRENDLSGIVLATTEAGLPRKVEAV